MKSPRILVVDDEAPLCAVLSDLLDLEGYEVEVCHDETSAREKLSQSSFDLALLDVFLTNQPAGIALGKQILADHPEMSLVFMTGYAEDADIRSGIGSGAHACIRKPFALDDVLRVVEIALDKGPGRRVA